MHATRLRLVGAAIVFLILLPVGSAKRAQERPASSPPVPSPETAMVYCPACGARNRAGDHFCFKDGAALPRLDPSRYRAGFVRSPSTYSPEEVQTMMGDAARSVVRIQVKTTSTYKYPVTFWKDAVAAYFARGMLGKITTSDLNARFSGSGFVISEEGEIVTNAHVASPDGQQTELTIETHDGRVFPATLVGSDPASDLALLRVGAAGLPPLVWGDSSLIRMGQETWAIGNPLDIGISITRGTISSLGGMRIGLNQVESFVHSDAHITHGNSGGPLVDVFGHVLGVNDIVASEAKGQGYAIPSRMTQLVIDRLRRNGRYERGFVGLHVRPVDLESSRRYAIARSDGSVVELVLQGSPAATAGIAPGDVVFGINDRQAPSTYLLQEAISSVGAGAMVTLMVDRRGTISRIPITTILRPPRPRIDSLVDLQNYLRVFFEQDSKKQMVFVRDPQHSRRAPGLRDGSRIKSVLPGQDWPEEPITLNYYKTRAKPVVVDSLQDLRRAFDRAYRGGRVAVTFEVDTPEAPIASVAFDEIWPIIL